MHGYRSFHAGVVVLGFSLFFHSALMAQTTSASSGSFSDKLWFHQVEISLISGNDNIGEGTSFSAGIINGLRMSDHFAVGAGLGWDAYDQMNAFPVYMRLIGLLKPTGHSPYIFTDGGYAWAREKNIPDFVTVTNAEGGLMFQAGAGYMFEGKGWRINVHAGYRLQKSALEVDYGQSWWQEEYIVSEERTRRRFTTGISFLF